MMNFYLLASTLLVGICSSLVDAATLGTEEVSFGMLRLELHSGSTSEARVLLADLVARTSLFLDRELGEYFSETISDEYFSHTGLGVVAFDIDNSQSSVVATVDLDGTAFFKTNPLPGPVFISDLLKAAFQGHSRSTYIELLQKSKAPYLKEISYLLVELNGQVIATDDLSHDFDFTQDSDDPGFWTHTNIIIISATCASVAACCFIGLVIYLLCGNPKKQPRKRPELRVKTSGSGGTDPDDVESAGPSPLHSIGSQESSKFTYNPRSVYGESTISGLSMESRTLPSHFSQIQVDTEPQFDVEAWTRHNTISPVTPAPFGNDISAIEPNTRDLSLILEASNEETTPATHGSRKSASSKLTHDALKDLENQVLNIEWKKQNRSHGLDDSYFSEEGSYGASDSSDVISDLKNLSLQINKQRASMNSDLYAFRE